MKFIIVLCAFTLFAVANSSEDDARAKRCYLKPKQDGVNGRRCKAYFPSWSYNADADRCEFFVYGGCGGNDNRFRSSDLCVEVCRASSVETRIKGVREKRCYLKAKQDGNNGRRCKAYIPSWSYNADTDRCEFFVYGGCGGNDNRFRTSDMCVNACKASSVETADIPEKDERCKQTPKKNGDGNVSCAAYFPSWSYNPATDRCEYFVYGGCGGNGNRFSSPDLCVDTCKAAAVDTPVIE